MSLEVALEHHERGYALLPLQAGGKKPNFRLLKATRGSSGWGSLAVRPASESEIREWHAIDPEPNFGVILGAPSGGLVVADFDREPVGVGAPQTTAVLTDRGRHLYWCSGRFGGEKVIAAARS
jgi:Bifunctional DNA primase/polymerase, N-terminal